MMSGLPQMDFDLRSRLDLLIHALTFQIQTFFLKLHKNLESETHQFWKEYQIPLEILLIATLFPSYLPWIKLTVRDGKLYSDQLDQSNRRLIEEGFAIVHDNNPVEVMPLSLEERSKFPRLETEKVQHYMNVLIKTCLFCYEEFDVVHPVQEREKYHLQKQFRHLLNYLAHISVVYTYTYLRRYIRGPAILERKALEDIVYGVEQLTIMSLTDFFEEELIKLFSTKYFLSQKIIVQHFTTTEAKDERPPVSISFNDYSSKNGVFYILDQIFSN